MEAALKRTAGGRRDMGGDCRGLHLAGRPAGLNVSACGLSAGNRARQGVDPGVACPDEAVAVGQVLQVFLLVLRDGRGVEILEVVEEVDRSVVFQKVLQQEKVDVPFGIAEQGEEFLVSVQHLFERVRLLVSAAVALDAFQGQVGTVSDLAVKSAGWLWPRRSPDRYRSLTPIRPGPPGPRSADMVVALRVRRHRLQLSAVSSAYPARNLR